MERSLRHWAEARRYEIAWGPAERLLEARREIAHRHDEGEFERELYDRELAQLAGTEPLPFDGTIVIVAKPRAASRVTFELEDGSVDAILPPTYERYRATFEDVRQDLAKHALPGTRIEHLHAPLKAVAARLGLVRYGRNNITYTPRAGSYVQLCGYLVDAHLAPSAADAAPRLLDQCAECSACQKACPTAAIDADRVLLRAERCLTFLNENPGPWPEWVPKRAHACVLGCVLCQRACPANPKLPIEDTGISFTVAETRSLLDSTYEQSRGENGIRTKLAWLGQPFAEPVLGRNLRAILAARGRA